MNASLDARDMSESTASGRSSGKVVTCSGNTYIFTNCTGIQIGDRKIQITNTTVDQQGPDHPVSFSKNKFGYELIRNILEFNNGMITILELEAAVKGKLEEWQTKSFKDVSGLPLKDFLTLHKDSFDVKCRKKTTTVKLKNRNKQVKKDRPSEEHTEVASPLAQFQDENYEYRREDSSSDDNSNWTTVQRKSRKTRDQVGNAAKAEPEVSHPMSETLKLALSHPESESYCFVANHKTYFKNPLKCKRDIVCLWNTPQRIKSYIVIGVKTRTNSSHALVGVNTSEDDYSFYSNLFAENPFNLKPVYQYYRIPYKSKHFGLIEIETSAGHGSPSIVDKTCKNQDVSLQVNELWYRKNSKNTVCEHRDLASTNIYQWFLGTKDVHENVTADLKNPISEGEQSFPADQKEENTSFDVFWKSVEGFKKGNFVLLSGDMEENIPNLSDIALAPWIAVYDFDIFGTLNGLFNAVQDALEEWRYLRIGTWQDSAPMLSENSTWWCFLRGRKEQRDTRTDIEDPKQKDNQLLFEDTHKWCKIARNGITDNCEQIVKFSEDCSPLTIVFLWPKSEELLSYMTKFLSRLTDALYYTPSIVVCLHKNCTSDKQSRKLETLKDEYDTLKICSLNFCDLCTGLSKQSSEKIRGKTEYHFPTASDHQTSPLNEKDAIWLREDLDVLFLESPYSQRDDDEELEEQITQFYKGGTLHWRVWYEKGGGKFEIDRDLMKHLSTKVERHLDNFKTSVITILHAPGSGGSTLAQRLLWQFHDRVPCVHARLGTIMNLQEFVSKVSFIYQRTHLPILILIDGEEEAKVRYISSVLKYSIILYVKRYPYPISKVVEGDSFFLKGVVTEQEAEKLCVKFGERCDERKMKVLQKLAADVNNKKTHYLYEFGMNVYLHEFRGIVSYVKGYLQLDSNSGKELYPWQKCLGYLSLVYYYGQTSIPAQFFAPLFSKHSNYAITLEDDFPYPSSEFIVYDTNSQRKNNLRICHFSVAKEILQQILSRHSNVTETGYDQLTRAATKNLASFCDEFIEYASCKKAKQNSHSDIIRHILTKTFIFRDEKDMSDNEEQTRRRPVLSRLMIDIPAGQPLFTERLRILQKLSSSFPNDPNFIAHVGRFHAFCRQDEEAIAESYFERAIKLCSTISKGKSEDELDDGTKSTLMHIYHMYGIVKTRSISRITGRSKDDAATMPKFELEFAEILKELVGVANLACFYFKKSRDITPVTKDVYFYAYTGEIQVRLQICDYVKRNFPEDRKSEKFQLFLSSLADETSKRFVKKSISKIESLLLECYMDQDLLSDDEVSLKKLVVWYNELFKNQLLSDAFVSCEDVVASNRLKIATKKLKFGSFSTFSGLEHIDDEKELLEIIELYEQIFDKIKKGGIAGYGRKELEVDFRDWIFAIRHSKCLKTYSVEDVLSRVEVWHSVTESPHSTFYLFVLRSLLGIGTKSNPGKTECLIEAKEMQDNLMKLNRLVIRPRYPREWLGLNENGIKQLVPGSRYVCSSSEERDAVQHGLTVCIGTICQPNKNKVGGYIEFNPGVVSVRVFYIPKRAVPELVGSRFAGRRVEFNLAFSVEFGYEAFNVRQLKRHGCSLCGKKLEFRSIDSELECCGKTVYRDSFNEIDD